MKVIDVNQQPAQDEDDDKDDCNTCGGSGYLDLDQTQVCPNCNGTGKA